MTTAAQNAQNACVRADLHQRPGDAADSTRTAYYVVDRSSSYARRYKHRGTARAQPSSVTLCARRSASKRRRALAYSALASDVPHAGHMASHIFYRRGLWADGVLANERAVGALAWTCAEPALVAQAYGGDQSLCARDALHAHDYAHYGLVQLGRLPEARRHRRTARALHRRLGGRLGHGPGNSRHPIGTTNDTAAASTAAAGACVAGD